MITTPTGDIGSQLVTRLLGHEDLRLIVRDPARLPAEVRDQVEVVTGSHGDPEVLDRALPGADAVFWLVPPDVRTPSLDLAYSGFTQAAAKAFPAHGVEHVVAVCALGRDTPLAGHAGLVTASFAMTDLIAASGVALRALACPTFMDNVARQAQTIREHGVYADSVLPDRRGPHVATADIAAAAARLLLDRSWTGQREVPLLGPEDLSAQDIVRTLSEVLGRPVRYQRQSLEEFRDRYLGYGASPAFAEGMVDMMRAKDQGLDAAVARTPENTTPTTFRQWCEQAFG
ncbi:uncharacterized protein YbjT (DUF2867 family) [Crossiella equi]|uniref:Uncharacterized protein YbjT (DUF2867 family) n=1 Tax=Crossiella equi TaxID=130796 RepID=A0ABS5A5K0_9PSEU|nr:uncharacterized protein YbjT (DUF2867 family) [Crossiella equi]